MKQLEKLKAEYLQICPDCIIQISADCQLGVDIPKVDPSAKLTPAQRVMISDYLVNLDNLLNNMDALAKLQNSGNLPTDLKQQATDIRAEVGKVDNEEIFALYQTPTPSVKAVQFYKTDNPFEQAHITAFRLRLALVHPDKGYPRFKADAEKLKGYIEAAITSMETEFALKTGRPTSAR